MMLIMKAPYRLNSGGSHFSKRWFFVFISLFCFTPLLLAASLIDAERQTAYEYVNKIRRQAGLQPFRRNVLLERAAINHAEYLTKNKVIGHLEDETMPGFTGAEPQDRATNAGFESRDVTENFSAGQNDSVSSVNGLMSAIYHRLSFLDLENDEIGIGVARDHEGLKFVYDMGSQALNQLCRFDTYKDEYPYYDNVCKRQKRISSARYDARKRERRKKSPLMVLWPSADSTDIPVVFYEEIPDPLPDIAVSGYPISVQLNPFYFRDIELIFFTLTNLDTGKEIKRARLITQKSDPNRRFKSWEFALFPLERLTWETSYQASIRLRANGKTLDKTWNFTTTSLSAPLIEITGKQERLLLLQGKKYAVYISPTANLPFVERLKWESFSGIDTTVERIDRNTIYLSLDGGSCQEVYFDMNGGRTFSARVSNREIIIRDSSRHKGLVSECVLSKIRDLSGFQVAGAGETLRVVSGLEYWVEIQEQSTLISNIRWQSVKGLTVDVDYIDRHIIKVRLTGSPGHSAKFFLSDKKEFTVLITGK